MAVRKITRRTPDAESSPPSRIRLGREPEAATDDTPDTPKGATGKRTAPNDDAGLVGVGWAGWRRTKAAAPSKWAKLYRVPEDGEGLVMFLEDGPFATVLLHWPDWIPRGQKPVFTCMGKENDCPLCEVGDSPQARARFNILDLNDEVPVLTAFDAGITLTDEIFALAERTGGLKNRYYGLHTTGQKQQKRTHPRPLKERDVVEDFGMEPLTKEEIDKFSSRLWDETSIDRSTRAELQKIADQATD